MKRTGKIFLIIGIWLALVVGGIFLSVAVINSRWKAAAVSELKDAYAAAPVVFSVSSSPAADSSSTTPARAAARTETEDTEEVDVLSASDVQQLVNEGAFDGHWIGRADFTSPEWPSENIQCGGAGISFTVRNRKLSGTPHPDF